MKLFKHQRDAIFNTPERHAWVWEMGTGKTRASIELAKERGEDTLIICPKALKKNWIEEIEKWDEEKVLFADVLTKEEFKRDWKILNNYSNVIVDEAHHFFGRKSALMKSLKGYFKKWNTSYRLFLTATPYRSSPFDIFVMADLLGYPMSYPVFFDQFFYNVRMGMRMIPMLKTGIEEDIAEIVKVFSTVVKLEDCIDVPPQSFETEYFELTKEQRQAKLGVPDILPIVRFTKFHQIMGGTLKGDEYSEAQVFKADKYERIVELAETNDKMIIVCRYNHEIEFLVNNLHKDSDHTHVRYINGSIEGDIRHEILKDLKGKKRYILIVNAACSEGWALSDCPLMIFYSLDFSLLQYVQMTGRIQRIDNIKRNTYLHLVVKGEIDEDIYENVVIKKMDFHLAVYEKEKHSK